MSQWLYTLRERFTANPSQRFDDYRAFSGFHHIAELVTLDWLMCPDLVQELRREDWEYNIQEDYRTQFFRDGNYLLKRQPLDSAQHQLMAVLESPPTQFVVPEGFQLCGFDIMDSRLSISTLTNCGPIPEAFKQTKVNNLGLLDDRDEAFAIRDQLRMLFPDDPHLGHCEVWLITRRLPDAGQLDYPSVATGF